MIAARVYGKPAPQGSKRAYIVRAKGKRDRVAVTESSAAVKPWREAVAAAWREAGAHLSGAVAVEARFYLDRPRGHYGTGRNADRLRPSAPLYPTSAPDLDKLVRSTLDGLTTANAYEDDARVVDLTTRKRYATPEQPAGVHLIVESVS